MNTYKLDKNGHPTPEACRAVATQIRNALKKYPDMGLDMSECRVKYDTGMPSDHECGTVHCHAGVFLLGSDELDTSRSWIQYIEGSKMMSEMLGFETTQSRIVTHEGCYDTEIAAYEKLEEWAVLNPARWGNANGGDMFADEDAFDGATNVSQIADWWDAVADRSEKLNSYKEES